MSNLRIREADAADVPLVSALRRAWVEELAGTAIDDRACDDPASDPGYEDTFAQWWAEEAGRRLCWLAEVDGIPVGMVSMAIFRRMPKPGRPRSCWGYVSNVFVLAEHRDRGVGAALLAAALERARRDHYARVVLSPSERSRPFYGRAGFGPADSLLVHPMEPR